MTSTLFEDLVSQYIDSNGKTRMLRYDLNGQHLSLMTSPIPPLNLPVEEGIVETPIETAISFIKERSLRIVSQDGTPKAIQGIWVETKEENSGIYYGYIPIRSTPPISKVPFAKKRDPISIDDTSALTSFRKNRKIAQFLKLYTLYTYALKPEAFGEDSLVVVPDHEYNIDQLNRRLFFQDNDVMYLNGRLIVPSQKIKDNLLAYLKVSLLNDTPGVLKLVDVHTAEDYYQTVSDFRVANNQLVFLNKSGLVRWMQESINEVDNSRVSKIVLPKNVEPYFYRHPLIGRDRLMIVQNVKDGTLERALAVGLKWGVDRVNIGFEAPPTSSDIGYTLYSGGSTEKVKGKGSPSILRYHDGTYAAILFFG